MMEKKISRGVKIFAWLGIILNIVTFLSSLDCKTFFGCFKSFNKNFIFLIILYSILSSIIGIISSIGLLRLKEIMRKVGIVINSLDLIFGVPLFFLSLKDIKQYSYVTAASEITKGTIKLDVNSFSNSIFYLIIYVSCAMFGLSLFFIFFFTRPKIREQFKR